MVENAGWVALALGSALFAGITSILAKIGLKNINSSLATALRTIIVLFFSWIMVLITDCQGQIKLIDGQTFLILAASGIATGASWLCYFRALQLGDVNKVASIDKSSTILTMILAVIFFNESLTLIKTAAMIIIMIGTCLMIEKNKEVMKPKNNNWFIYAFASAFFAALTSIIAKMGMTNINSNLGTFIRTVVVLIMAWVVVFVQGSISEIKEINQKNVIFLILSGIATGLSWLCYFKALQLGDASIVVPIDKLSIVVTVLFSVIVLKEAISKKIVLGLILIIGGTMILLI